MTGERGGSNIAKVIARYVLGDLWGPNVVIIGRFSRFDEYIFAINGVPTIVTSPWEHFNRDFQSSRFVYIIIFIWTKSSEFKRIISISFSKIA